VVHEVVEKGSFFSQIFTALHSGGRLLVVEPRLHVSRKAFRDSVAVATTAGFYEDGSKTTRGSRESLLRKQIHS
jgi:hypothetical protein